MRVEQTHVQRTKAGLHAVQVLITFVAGCLALSVVTKAGRSGTAMGFYFALCLLSIPSLTYQIIVPMWTRAWKVANVYAYVGIDLLFSTLWFSAFVSVAVWLKQGLEEGKQDTSTEGGTGFCARFTFGSASKCEVSRAVIGMGAILWLLWSATSAISVRTLLQHRRMGTMPGRIASDTTAVHDESRNIWSTKIKDRNDASVDDRRRYGQTDEADGYGPMRYDKRSGSTDTQTEDGLHPGRALSYGSSVPSMISTPAYDANAAPSALSPTEELRQSVHENFTGMGAVSYAAGSRR